MADAKPESDEEELRLLANLAAARTKYLGIWDKYIHPEVSMLYSEKVVLRDELKALMAECDKVRLAIRAYREKKRKESNA